MVIVAHREMVATPPFPSRAPSRKSCFISIIMFDYYDQYYYNAYHYRRVHVSAQLRVCVVAQLRVCAVLRVRLLVLRVYLL